MFWKKNNHPAGLKRRVAYAFVLLISCMAFLSAVAVKSAFEYAETTITDAYMSDISTALLRVLAGGGKIHLPPSMGFYGDIDGLEPIPERYQNLPMGFTEITDSPAVFAYRNEWQGSSVILIRDQESIENVERRMWLATLLSAVAAVVLAAVLGVILSRRIMGPVEKLSEAVRNAATGTSYRAIPRDIMTNDEVGTLAQICDSSMGRLYEALEREKAFTGDVSHELRTPLTVIETSSELLEISHLTPQQSRQVGRILKAVNQMRESVALFLKLARGDRNIENASSDTVRGLFQLIKENWEPLAARKGIQLQFEAKTRCPGTYSPILLETVMNNLVKNAVMYVPENGRIAIVETSRGFLVADDGPGIPLAEQVEIFKPHVRGSSSCGEGDGLGLAIILKICERTGWRLRLMQSAELPEELSWASGAVFEVSLREPPPGKQDTLGC